MSEHIYCKNCKYPTIGGAMDGYCNYSNDEDYIESPIYGKLHYVKCEIRNANFDCPYYEFDDGGAEEKNKRESAQKLKKKIGISVFTEKWKFNPWIKPD